MKTLSCTINNTTVQVPEGTSVIEAFRQADIDIAHYCWHPGLSVAGVCRLCMVEVEGVPKLQIACNTKVTEGMKVNNQSEAVKQAVRWGMDFHLINHPLDCPICDQAGECGLQEQYMKFGAYEPEMAERKVKKSKVVDLGSKIVLDSERCILCSRCVRFCDEVSKTNELGIFDRGDKSEIASTRPLENNYSLNTVDICPVGALTAKDFRFRQRVWYLKSGPSICTGCSTGCNVNVYYNEEGLWRVKPRHNENINGHWMCDEGRNTYQFVNPKNRLQGARVLGLARNKLASDTGDTLHKLEALWQAQNTLAVAQEVGLHLQQTLKNKGPQAVGLVLTGQQCNEEYASVLQYFGGLAVNQIYHWTNFSSPEQRDQFDGLLLRGDRNPNTKGLLDAAQAAGVKLLPWTELERSVPQLLFVVGPENQALYPELKDKVAVFLKAQALVWLSACKTKALDEEGAKLLQAAALAQGQTNNQQNNQTNGQTQGQPQTLEALQAPCVWQVPLKTYVEKSGTYTNYQGVQQKVEPLLTVAREALDLQSFVRLMQQKLAAEATEQSDIGRELKNNQFVGEGFYEHP